MPENASRFPVTVWPSSPLPPLPVERWDLTADDAGTIYPGGPLEPSEALPPEWVLRQLGDADLDDNAIVVALLQRYGVIGWPYFDPAVVPEGRHARLGHLPTAEEDDHWWESYSNATVEDVRWWLKTARALARTWGESTMGRDPVAAWVDEGFVGIPDERSCWSLFALALNAGLRSSTARVEIPAHGIVFGAPRFGLYSAACQQVFNLVVQGESARRCESETCGRMFVHQLGGAQHGQHRTKGPLRFCSPECAHAETQRQYRRRQKAARKDHP